MVQEMNVSCHVRTEIVQSVADCTHLRRQMVLSRETVESSLWKSKHKGQLGLHKQDGDLAVTERSPSIATVPLLCQVGDGWGHKWGTLVIFKQ